MATIPTDTATVDALGLIQGIGVMVNKTIQSMNKNEPIFGVGDVLLKGYIAVGMYDQISSSVIQAGTQSEQGQEAGGNLTIYTGNSFASGKPYVMVEYTYATNINLAP